MDTFPRFEEVLALGRKLVDELGQEPRVDTLARWMAHYVAELIDGAANAPPNERRAAGRECFETIMELWDHRAALPDGRRPFEKLEPVMRALESLDPNDDTPRYFGPAKRAMGSGDESAAQSVLEFVNSVDDAARVTIAYALVEPAQEAADFGVDVGVEAVVVGDVLAPLVVGHVGGPADAGGVALEGGLV